MRKIFLAAAAIGMFLAAQPAHAQGAIAREILLASVRPEPPRLAIAAPVPAPQSGSTGTAHGVNLAWTASTTSGVTYSVYRQVGTFTAATWPSPIGTPIATGLVASPFLDPASGLTAGTTYSYGVGPFPVRINRGSTWRRWRCRPQAFPSTPPHPPPPAPPCSKWPWPFKFFCCLFHGCL